MTAVLAVKGLSLGYREGEWLCRHLNFSLQEGELLGVIGPSGCGKSTLCLALSGIIPHRVEGHMEGDVFLLGKIPATFPAPDRHPGWNCVSGSETQLFCRRSGRNWPSGRKTSVRPERSLAR